MDIGKWINIFFVAYIVISMLKGVIKGSRKAKQEKRGIPVVCLSGAFSQSNDRESTFRSVMDQLDRVEQIGPKAMILQVNSPGSTTGAAYEVYTRINAMRKKGLKVVAMMEDVAASGGVYVSMASDHIIATPGTLTGSIGVILQNYDVSELLPHLKIAVRTIKSGAMKDILAPTRPMTEAEKGVLDSMVVDMWTQFCEVVAESRKLGLDVVKGFADGRIFSGRQAKEIGLIDEVGSFSDALRAAGRLAGIAEADCKPVSVARGQSIGFWLRKMLPGSRLEDSVRDAIPSMALQGVPLYMMPRL